MFRGWVKSRPCVPAHWVLAAGTSRPGSCPCFLGFGQGGTGCRVGQPAGNARPSRPPPPWYILTTAKGIASGLPISAIADSTHTMSKTWPGSRGGTYGGTPAPLRRGLPPSKVKEEGLVENCRIRGEQLQAGLNEIQERLPVMGDVRARCLISGLVLTAEEISTGLARFEAAVGAVVGAVPATAGA